MRAATVRTWMLTVLGGALFAPVALAAPQHPLPSAAQSATLPAPAPASAAQDAATTAAAEAAAGLAYARQYAVANAGPLPTSIAAVAPLKASPSSASVTMNTIQPGLVVLVYACKHDLTWCEVAYGNSQFGWVRFASLDPAQAHADLPYIHTVD